MRTLLRFGKNSRLRFVSHLDLQRFFQRALKSQKGSVGRCTFEPTKSRCPVSHPRFEEFRMLSFVNNIRITGPGDNAPRPLTQEEFECNQQD